MTFTKNSLYATLWVGHQKAREFRILIGHLIIIEFPHGQPFPVCLITCRTLGSFSIFPLSHGRFS